MVWCSSKLVWGVWALFFPFFLFFSVCLHTRVTRRIYLFIMWKRGEAVKELSPKIRAAQSTAKKQRDSQS